MGAHRRVNAATDARVLQHLAVNPLAHAVQALQFKGQRPAQRRSVGAHVLCHLEDGRDGACVVGGELGVDRVRGSEQRTGTGQVADVGVVFVGEHRIAGQPQLLSALDFGIPVSTLDQAAHQANLVTAGHGRQVLDQLNRPRLVGLKGQAKPGPLRETFGDLGDQGLEHIQGQLQAVDLFGVDGQVEVGAGRGLAQGPHSRHQLAHDALVLEVFVAWMQRAEFDGDAVVLGRRCVRIGGASDGSDGVLVAGQVTQGVGVGAGALAQHVVAETQIGLLLAGCAGLLHGLGYRLPQDKLATQQLHGAQGGGHHRLGPQLGHQAGLAFRSGEEFFGQGNGR